MLRALTLCLPLPCWATASKAVFDVHVHLHDGEASLQAYQQDIDATGLTLSGMAALWFGGPHQAGARQPAAIRSGNAHRLFDR